MKQFILQCQPSTEDGGCTLCGQPAAASAGVRLALADGSGPVCSDCARKTSPSLAALMDLADAAERVGRIGRHTVVPPMTALLELARAAENYVHAAPPRPRFAASGGGLRSHSADERGARYGRRPTHRAAA